MIWTADGVVAGCPVLSVDSSGGAIWFVQYTLSKISNPKETKPGSRDSLKKVSDRSTQERKQAAFQKGLRQGLEQADARRDSILEAQRVRIENLLVELQTERDSNLALRNEASSSAHVILDLRSELSAARDRFSTAEQKVAVLTPLESEVVSLRAQLDAAKQRIANLDSENRRLKYGEPQPPPPPRSHGLNLATGIKIPRKK